MSDARKGIQSIQERMQARLRETTGVAIPGEQAGGGSDTPPIPAPTVPVTDVTRPPLVAGEVLFKAPRAVFNFIYKGKQISFLYGWLKTSDVELAAHIRKNFPKIQEVKDKE